MSSFNRLHDYLLNHGIYLGPSGYEVGFVSSAHSVEELTHAAQLFCHGLDLLYAGA